MTFTLCSSGAITRKAGPNVNASLAASAAVIAEIYDESEGIVVTRTRRDWVNSYSTVASGAKYILVDTVSCLGAVRLINMDMSGYTSRMEAQTMIDVLTDQANDNIKALEDFKSVDIKAP